MRNLLLPLLLASVAATPALAQRPDRSDRPESRADRQQAREDRQQARDDRSSGRQERSNDEDVRVRSNDAPSRPEIAGGGDPGSNAAVNAPPVGDAAVRGGDRDRAADAAKLERPARRDAGDSLRVGGGAGRQQQVTEGSTAGKEREERRNEARQNRDIRDTVRTPPKQSAAERQQLREERRETARTDRELRQAERPSPAVLQPRVPVVSNTPREGTQPPPRTEVRRQSPTKWSSHWRKDRRYDWYNWRKRNRWLFNLGFYNDPFGWGYRPYSIGWRMWPSYYRSSYWLNDPWEYRLPYAPPGYRWIRYYDDAILIDTWNGQIVDVIYNFFW